ncbi:MAG: phenylalanine--tRNA ligase subunit beta [Alphaproteobacteria bacterium]|nr:phenylalanine--tRNA ligase subunit beta [Alphaproteobacteria bacterium]
MKLTLDWLRQHLATDAGLEVIAARLVALGHEVEGIVDRAAALAPFTVAYVIEAKPHPNADRLRVCRVQTGAGEVEVVCGAPNARTGMKGVFAPVGTVIPGTGVKLKKSAIRGVESNGMLCSEREMGLGQDHDGIIELAADAPVGEPFARVMGLDDPLLDVKVTADRGDCLGVRGLARDLAASGLGTLVALDTTPVPGRFTSPIGVTIQPDAAATCPLYVGRLVRGVRNGPSPRWLADKLVAVGLRPISTLVDITNWMTVDLCRPVHMFDANKLKGGIQVRLGRAGESFLALNGKTYPADETTTMIADDAGPLGFGGIIGGESSGCDEATTAVFIEIALFDAVRTAATGRRLAIESDARHRFERGVDPAFAVPGMEITTRLILELCGGEPSELVIAGDPTVAARALDVRPPRFKALGGLDVARPEARRWLEALGCQVADQGEAWRVTVPTWRHDLQIEADMVEEVLRLGGFDAIPPVSLPRASALTRPVLTTSQARARLARCTLAARGLSEAVTWSFVPAAHAALFSGDNRANPELRLANPINAELDWMRPSTLPNLIAALGRNRDRGTADAGLFEVGPTYGDATPKGQGLVAGAARAGQTGPRHWSAAPRAVDALDAKADALAVLATCGVALAAVQTGQGGPAWYHPGRSGTLRLGPTTVATFGELNPRVLAALDVPGPLVGCEVHLDRLPEPKARASRVRGPLDAPPFLPVVRDFAFVVDAAVAAEAILRAARGADRQLITHATVFDVYRGKGLPDGKVSVAVAVTLQPRAATLTDAEIEAAGARIVAAVAKATGATLRS